MTTQEASTNLLRIKSGNKGYRDFSPEIKKMKSLFDLLFQRRNASIATEEKIDYFGY